MGSNLGGVYRLFMEIRLPVAPSSAPTENEQACVVDQRKEGKVTGEFVKFSFTNERVKSK
jgi:hypothetical protein